jgi:hypothetical protein
MRSFKVLEDLNDGHRYAGVTVRNPFDDLVMA